MIKTELDKLLKTLRYGIIIFIIMYILKMLFWVSLILGIFYISIVANKVANEFTPVASTSGGSTITLNATHYNELGINKTIDNIAIRGKDAGDCIKCGGIYNQQKEECRGTACY